ncbi:hypothetical protein BSL78_16773 [Apostichopus japonicus]|uniref:Reverse transcriptase domain-containing protein n=1 Tax=Stichopus japonicus TaxID=307972 RepID=A0A2G8KED5_STIJA|nr:hypothetical protein BSL78_16773 [Apostichopus japonicus]
MYMIQTHDGKSKLTIKLNIEYKAHAANVDFEIDTGSEVCAISPEVLDSIAPNVNLKPPSQPHVKMYSGQLLKILGEVDLQCTHQNERYILTFKVLETNQAPLLSRQAAIKMNLITLAPDVHKIDSHTSQTSYENEVNIQYSDLFTGLGCLPGEYHKIKDNVTPVKQGVRRVPIALKQQLKEQLHEMEKGASSNASQQLRICIDPRDLNKALKRPHYPIPTIESILPELANAKIFSVIDAKEAYWQIKLDKESSYLTTMATPFGRYRWLRLPCGMNTATEEFQRRQNEMIEGFYNVTNIADDFLIYVFGETTEEATLDHDKHHSSTKHAKPT